MSTPPDLHRKYTDALEKLSDKLSMMDFTRSSQENVSKDWTVNVVKKPKYIFHTVSNFNADESLSPGKLSPRESLDALYPHTQRNFRYE